jgi:nitroreductase
MEFSDLIRSRESVRNYDPDRPVPPEIMTRILDAGRLAPSACNLQPWRFLVISSDDTLEKVRKCYPRDWFRDAPHIIVIAGLKDQAWVRKYDSYNSIETDLAIAMTHLILAAENEGVATCWVEAYDPALIREALKIPENQVIFGITPLGYPKTGYKKNGVKQRRPLENIAEFL